MNKRTILFTVFSLALGTAVAVLNIIDLILQVRDR